MRTDPHHSQAEGLGRQVTCGDDTLGCIVAAASRAQALGEAQGTMTRNRSLQGHAHCMHRTPAAAAAAHCGIWPCRVQGHLWQQPGSCSGTGKAACGGMDCLESLAQGWGLAVCVLNAILESCTHLRQAARLCTGSAAALTAARPRTHSEGGAKNLHTQEPGWLAASLLHPSGVKQLRPHVTQ